MKVQAAALLLLPLAASAFVPAAPAPASGAKGRSLGMAADGMSRKDALKTVGAGALCWVVRVRCGLNQSIDPSIHRRRRHSIPIFNPTPPSTPDTIPIPDHAHPRIGLLSLGVGLPVLLQGAAPARAASNSLPNGIQYDVIEKGTVRGVCASCVLSYVQPIYPNHVDVHV